jgi:hypothetical protein
VFSQGRSTASKVSGNFTVPQSAKNGNTRMRISMKYNRNPTACEVFSYGEVEDYTLSVSGGNTRLSSEPLAVEAAIEEAKLVAWPNPARAGVDVVSLQLPEPPLTEGKIQVVELSGRILLTQAVKVNERSEISIETTRLKAGIYLLVFEADGKKHTERLLIK